LPIGFVIGQDTLIRFVHQVGRKHKIGRSPITGHKNVPDGGQPQQSFYIRVVRLLLQRVLEKHHKI
jgi:hypothetical protein